MIFRDKTSNHPSNPTGAATRRLLPLLLPLGLLANQVAATEVEGVLLTKHLTDNAIVHTTASEQMLPNLRFTDDGGEAGVVIPVDAGQRHQSLYGYGISFDRSSMANLLEMSPTVRAEVLRRLFDPDAEDGVRFNLIRYPLGTSDFTGTEWYTYNDMPKGEHDPELEHFSIDPDRQRGFIALLREVLQINPDIRLIGATWSPPAWMKERERLIYGKDLKPEYRATFAAYLRKTLQAFAEEGIPFAAISLQNEPEVRQSYPSCKMSTETILAVQQALRREFDEHGVRVGILVGDTQWNQAERYPFPQARQAVENDNPYVIGAAWHFYGGNPRAMQRYLEEFPEQLNLLTEVQMTIRNDRRGKMSDGLEYFHHGAHGMIDWVTCLDSAGEPINPGNPWNVKYGRVLIPDHQNPDQWHWSKNYYNYRMLTRYTDIGAVRIDSPRRKAHLSSLAWENPDGSISLIIATRTNLETVPATPLTVVWNGRSCRIDLPAEHALLSLRWNPEKNE